MKTEFTFKQHEAETANRKVPWSVRSNRIGRGPEPTPVPISSQMRAWNQNISNAGPSRAEPQSPRRPRFGDISRNERARKPPPPENKNMPSGFQTTTNPSSPTRSQNVKGKGKASAFSIPARPPTIFESGSQIFGGGSLFNAPVRSSQEAVDNPALDDTIMGASQIIDQNHVAPADIEMADVANIAYLATPFEEEIEEFEPRNWNIVLRRSILTHIAPDQKSFTFQVLVGAPITTSISSQSAELYQSSCGQLLNILSQTSHDDRDFRYSLGVASQSLAQIARILAIADLISELSAVFNLLTHLIYTVPNFHPYLLPVCDLSQGKDAPSLILQILCEVIRHKFVAIKADHENDMSGLPSLVRALLGLIEAMCWNLPNDLEDWLAFIPRSPLVLTTLLDTARPQWMLLRSVRVLLWLSTRHSLFRSLLSFPAAETSNQEQEKETEIPDITRLPHIETLCSLLADTERKGAEAESMRNFILSFFAMLCVSHTDAHTILVESRAVIPSLLVYMTRLSTTLWEDDEVLMASPSLASSWISSLNQSLCLFHYVIFGAESMPNLRERLELAQSYNGLMHMFIVTIGRMSYAEPPEWVDAKDKADLEEVSDMARELLELVVEGPEGDSIWSTYQEQNDRNSDIAIDDDEEEARKLVNDGV
ncbi:hypothetical protein BJ138DRAFT_1148438 [Hygrophoropsis aurantiaca]|uniref:Uncharacterized protein n=1 Tax=Hygrophoropsis aurantiaca TaxID=72124 RepID=A0ACB8AGD9_9AGAM|nr:hypothetical protein BJ138DRAFT_1148438 [Hygrophoropsis aurantiaca]